VASPRVDAELLAAHVLGVRRSGLLMAPDPTDDAVAAFDALVARRAAREPLQHLLGTAVLGPVEVAVGPGVFVPRPETELLHEWAVAVVADTPEPLVVDLCTGTGALALAVAASRPDARVHAVEVDPDALVWARRNTAGTAVVLHQADVTDPDALADVPALAPGTVDLVIANPPYVPEGTEVGPEVRHDPHRAVFAGDDGLAVVRPMVALAARLLRPGGHLGVEHDEGHADAVAAELVEAGFDQVATRDDLTGRPRFAVGLRS
jgi:release factor glutamine methyltransferase